MIFSLGQHRNSSLKSCRSFFSVKGIFTRSSMVLYLVDVDAVALEHPLIPAYGPLEVLVLLLAAAPPEIP